MRREALEETGVRIEQVAYHSSQPWPFPRSLMLGYRAVAHTARVHADGEEILDVQWFTREQLLAYSDTTVPDLLGPDCRLLFSGINPGLWTAATGAHFARPGNRFYPALYGAGIVDHVIESVNGPLSN